MRSFFSNRVTAVAGARQLLGAGHAGRPRPHDRDALARPARRDLRGDPAFRPAAVDDRAFDRLDRHRVVVDVEGARRLARRRADAAGEFREIVGRVQRDEGLAPLVAIDQVVPVRDQIVDRAAVMAKRNAAIHAARGLGAQRRLRQGMHELPPAFLARRRLLIAAVGALDLQEPGRLAHQAPLNPAAAEAGQYCCPISMMAHPEAQFNNSALNPRGNLIR